MVWMATKAKPLSSNSAVATKAAPNTAALPTAKGEPTVLKTGKTTETRKGEQCSLMGVAFTSPGGVIHSGSKKDCQWPDLSGRPKLLMLANADGSGVLLTPVPGGLKAWAYGPGLLTAG